MIFFVLFLSMLLTIFITILTMVNKNLKTKKILIDSLKSQISDERKKNNKLNDVINTNRRKDHRIEVYNTTADVHIISTEEEKFKKVVGKKFEGTISDISHSGIKVLSNYSLPIQGRFMVEVHFTLYEENFALKAIMLRKEEHLKESDVSYGFQFIKVSNRQEQNLAFVLHKIEAERRMKTS